MKKTIIWLGILMAPLLASCGDGGGIDEDADADLDVTAEDAKSDKRDTAGDDIKVEDTAAEEGMDDADAQVEDLEELEGEGQAEVEEEIITDTVADPDMEAPDDPLPDELEDQPMDTPLDDDAAQDVALDDLTLDDPPVEDLALDDPAADDPAVEDIRPDDVAAEDTPAEEGTALPRCGNNLLEGTEQCDDNDGTPANLDGCDTVCKYEAMVRMTSVAISGSRSFAGCTPTTNFFGRSVLTSTARTELNNTLQGDVDAGGTNILLQFLGIDDLTGVNDPSLQLGIMVGDIDPARGAWPGNSPIDWWYLIAPSSLDPNNLPKSLFTTASIASRVINGGPNDVTLTLLLAGTEAQLHMLSSRISASVSSSPAPNRPAPPPDLLAAGTTMFQTISASASTRGLCGNITVESLSKIPLPEVLSSGGAYACASDCSNSRSYTYCGSGQPVGPNCNSMLDAIVGGCQARVYICINLMNPSQPDVMGTGTFPLTLGARNKVPSEQTEGNTYSYSAYLTFGANRGHATGRATYDDYVP